jgi:hypothetical protein
MDRREMKKRILEYALVEFGQRVFDDEYQAIYVTSIIVDEDETKVSEAEVKRMIETLQKMVENAQDKLK